MKSHNQTVSQSYENELISRRIHLTITGLNLFYSIEARLYEAVTPARGQEGPAQRAPMTDLTKLSHLYLCNFSTYCLPGIQPVDALQVNIFLEL